MDSQKQILNNIFINKKFELPPHVSVSKDKYNFTGIHDLCQQVLSKLNKRNITIEGNTRDAPSVGITGSTPHSPRMVFSWNLYRENAKIGVLQVTVGTKPEENKINILKGTSGVRVQDEDDISELPWHLYVLFGGYYC